jgi:hypothetical protein
VRVMELVAPVGQLGLPPVGRHQLA